MGLFDKIQDTISSATEQTKAKGQEVQLKRDRTQKLAALGEQVYGMYLQGQLPAGGLEPALQEIVDIDRRLTEAEQAYQAARTQPQAPGAQAEPPSAQYAPPPPGAPAPPQAQQYAPPPPAAPQAPAPPEPQPPPAAQAPAPPEAPAQPAPPPPAPAAPPPPPPPEQE
ncbi:MAG: hypothetical protein KKF41_14870 [Actinobacteria bacterium]|nr:hypothetical protein [Actinomycetota bacterium]MBU1944768.1 hypothetical protein [Actinomycetota bacterium]MBU2688859.1 hypothetical protein [Actinomycetota bacterium]